MLQSVIGQVCRLARTIASPQESAHTVLVAEGCPGRCTVIAKLAAHLCGYTVYQVSPCSLQSSREYKMEQFKSDLVQCYTRAGSKVSLQQVSKLLEAWSSLLYIKSLTYTSKGGNMIISMVLLLLFWLGHFKVLKWGQFKVSCRLFKSVGYHIMTHHS